MKRSSRYMAGAPAKPEDRAKTALVDHPWPEGAPRVPCPQSIPPLAQQNFLAPNGRATITLLGCPSIGGIFVLVHEHIGSGKLSERVAVERTNVRTQAQVRGNSDHPCSHHRSS